MVDFYGLHTLKGTIESPVEAKDEIPCTSSICKALGSTSCTTKTLKSVNMASEVAQQVKTLTAQRCKADDLSSVPKTNIKVEGKSHLHQAIL